MKIFKKITIFSLIITIITFCFTGCSLFGEETDSSIAQEGTPLYYIQNDELVKPSQNNLFRYKIYEHYVSISEYIGEETNITIPDKIEDLPVYVVEEFSFADNKTISSITMSDNIVQIGTSCFSCCSLLKTVKLPEELETIPNEAFYSCSALEDIKLPETLKEISPKAFYECTSLTSIVIPSSVETVGNSAFSYCSNLKKVVFMDGVIGDEEGNYIKTVYKTLDSNIFSDCSALETILVPDSVFTIDEYAFSKLSKEAFIYGYVPSSISDYCATQKINFIEVVEGDDKDRQMKDRAIIVPETETKPEKK